MKRRDFLKLLATGMVVGGLAPEALAQITKFPHPTIAKDYDAYIKDYLYKMRHFDRPHKGDVYLDHDEYRLLKSSVQRLKRLQRTIGHGNFYLLSFDNAIKFARSHRRVGRFPKEELDFLEMIFNEDGVLYGFFGEKPLKNLTARIKRREVVKVPNTGNYLYKGQALEMYKRVKREIGGQMVLTSGVRSVMKQFLLFLNKAYRSKGNLSMASRSLAPPGYSFHGIGDFDVGQVGFGSDNFTERFVTTKVYKKLKKRGYIKIRYARDNLLGVRFEPWHIKINPTI
jgi:RNA-binding protein YhbY